MKTQKYYYMGFLANELPAFWNIIIFQKAEGEDWLARFQGILKELVAQSDKGDGNGELVREFINYRNDFYKTIIHDSYLVAFNAEKEDQLKKTCIETTFRIVGRALCIDNGNKRTVWTQKEKRNSETLRYFRSGEVVMDKEDCLDAMNGLWDYLQEDSCVVRNGEKIIEKRLLNFDYADSPRLLVNAMAKGNDCWLKKVLIRIGNHIPKYKNKIMETITSSDTGISIEDIPNPPSDDELLLYQKRGLAAHWAYFSALMAIMPSVITKQYEAWLLRAGMPQMLAAPDKAVSIDDTSAILACLTHDSTWQAEQGPVEIDGRNLWANDKIWTHGKAEKRPLFNDLVKNAVRNIGKLNALFYAHFLNSNTNLSPVARKYFDCLFRKDPNFNLGSTNRLTSAFQQYLLTQDKTWVCHLSNLLNFKGSEEETDDFLETHSSADVIDEVHSYFTQIPNRREISAREMLCRHLADVPDLSAKTIETLRIQDIM